MFFHVLFPLQLSLLFSSWCVSPGLRSWELTDSLFAAEELLGWILRYIDQVHVVVAHKTYR